MDWDPPELWTGMETFLHNLGATLPVTPRAILVISAHWQAPRFTVTSAARPTLLYDYYGFPPHTYELRYPAPGHPELAQRVQQLLDQAGIASAADSERGLDHGVFIPLKVAFPDARIPVLSLSLQRDRDAQAHLDAGRALAPLRDEGVLIIGSGMSFHNMRAYGNPAFEEASEQFDHWLTQTLCGAPETRTEALANWTRAPGARQSHPVQEDEHLIPLMVAAGAAEAGRGERIYTERILFSRISAYRFD